MRYRFEDCELDTETHELRRGGAVQAVQPQVFDLLCHLVRNPDRLITRDELIGRIWGGRIVSEAAIDSRINAARRAVGDDGTRQAVIRTVARRGIRFVAPIRQEGAPAAAGAPVQTVRFCRSADGTRIAYGLSGTGPPLLRAGHWLTHLDHDWHSPIWRPFLDALGRFATVVRYDQRGTGLSERAVEAFDLDIFVADLAAVADAAGLARFPIYATSQGVPVALEYAARHPDRVSGLILHGGFAKGRLLRSEAERAQGEAYITLMRHGWAAEGSQFLQAFASIFIPDGTPEQIRDSVPYRLLHRHLREGDCYQGNLTFPVRAQWSGDPLAAFDALTARQPVRHGALVALDGPVVLSRSPELFFKVDAEGWIETLPMKGTAPRGATKEEDERLREFLRADEKNQAENRMIVDLLRNDISLVSEVGSLDVPELFRIETYPTLHQMVSRVRAKLLPGLSIRRIFAALFPCGSITGAPKIRAMEILHELEGTPRDVYCGAIGWIAPNGTMRFSVAIRTISLFPDGEAVYNVGGGVVFDSTAEEEYAECLLKARFATGSAPASG